MFGKRRASPPASLLTPDLIQLIVESSVELTAKNATATETWGIGTADRWSADLLAGSITFHFPDHSITGPVEVLGTWSSESGTWLWAWANESLPPGVTGASTATKSYGDAHALEALSARKLDVTEALAEDLASVTVEIADLAGMYRAPTTSGYLFLGFTTFEKTP
jgi:hypothetical protein